MPKGLVNESSLNSIAEAINVLKGVEDTYYPSEMGEAIIDAIPTETASGNPIHITDAAAYPADSVVTTLEPVQDLHGYDKPWPAGGGKNLLQVTTESQTINDVTFTVNKDSAGNVVSITVNGTASSDVNLLLNSFLFKKDTSYILNGCPLNGGNSTYQMASIGGTIATGYDIGSGATITPTQDYEASIRIFIYAGYTANNLVFKPMIRLASVTDATFEPYSNECPITGHTGVELTRTGKNLLNPLKMKRTNPTTGAENNNWLWWNQHIPCKYGDNITFSCPNAPSQIYSCNLAIYDEALSSVGSETLTWGATSGMTFTITKNNAAFALLRFYNNTSMAAYNFSNAQLELGNQATSYEPYQGKTHSITFPQAQSPVYGGEIDWTNGVLRVTDVKHKMSDLSNTLVYYQQYGFFLSQNGFADKALGISAIKSSIYATSTAESATDIKNNEIRGNDQYNAYVYIRDDRFSNVSDLMAAVGNTDICYPLATPIEIPLTSEVITLLKGENNLWTDAGTSEIEYKVDLNSYIQKLIAEASGTTSALSLSKSAVEPESETEASKEVGSADEESVALIR